MSYKKMTIADIVEIIDSRNVYLPAIQRKYVWTQDQIIRLMDSIMRGYPFGTFLFWKMEKKIVNESGYALYEFIKDYHELEDCLNKSASQPFNINEESPDKTILAALDGQQRLTSLYIALKGSMAIKIPRKHSSNPDAYPVKQLYLNLHSTAREEEDLAYEFAFMSQEEFQSSISSTEKIWYRVKDILQFPELTDLNDWISQNNLLTNRIATKNLTLLYDQIKRQELINYFEIDSDNMDDILDIFVRVNSGGTVLSKTDLLFSTIVSYWNDGRDEIDALLGRINKIGDHYSFTNDFIMRTCLYIMNLSTTLNVTAFGKKNVETIKNNWGEIRESIIDTVNLLNELGFNWDSIVAVNVILPIVLYRHNYGKDAFKVGDDGYDVRFELRKFIVIAQIKRIFGQSTSSTLSAIRTELNKHKKEKFNLSFVQNLSFAGGKNLLYGRDDIELWFDEFEKNSYTYMILSLLYPNLKYGQTIFHQDHMHPYSSFEKTRELKQLILPDGRNLTDDEIKLWRHQRNTLANLQLLEGRDNESKNKTPLSEWLEIPGNRENVKYLPENIDLQLNGFECFLNERKKLMLAELERILL